ncbi:hypothetical protein crov418 [Cafeteria roenbergensis virus]|uniref:Uncharacterized protein n=1 Tax=Cafeteria roenbergensis virus (strain BV-PW1) TaxID=693272 RepID=E3T5I9_CROVB|nr:hypothetical protein crov418 [Cafeteria roenbergensis virus BV-PW1]ADO67452.1 hypothetical protein crov418 [Cafeteria roenbergensis virus BV-PW1]
MDTKYEKIIEIIQINNKLAVENNKLLKELCLRVDKMEKTDEKMDNHIDNIMGIYNGYKAPLDYIKSYFGSTITNKTTTQNIIEK